MSTTSTAAVAAATADAVQRARLARGWTQQELADAAGVSRSTVARVEAAEAGQAGKARRILDALGLGEQAATPEVPDDVRLVQELVREVLLGQPVDVRRRMSVEIVAHLIRLRG